MVQSFCTLMEFAAELPSSPKNQFSLVLFRNRISFLSSHCFPHLPSEKQVLTSFHRLRNSVCEFHLVRKAYLVLRHQDASFCFRLFFCQLLLFLKEGLCCLLSQSFASDPQVSSFSVSLHPHRVRVSTVDSQWYSWMHCQFHDFV